MVNMNAGTKRAASFQRRAMLTVAALINTRAAVGSYPVLWLSVANGAQVFINAHW